MISHSQFHLLCLPIVAL